MTTTKSGIELSFSPEGCTPGDTIARILEAVWAEHVASIEEVNATSRDLWGDEADIVAVPDSHDFAGAELVGDDRPDDLPPGERIFWLDDDLVVTLVERERGVWGLP